jgi:prevent-host-death family protein
VQTVTKAEAERDFAAVIATAAREPVRIVEDGRDLVVVSAAEFEEAQELLRRKRMRALRRASLRVAAEAKANGFTAEMLPEFLR